jgi:hypothetical protein
VGASGAEVTGGCAGASDAASSLTDRFFRSLILGLGSERDLRADLARGPYAHEGAGGHSPFPFVDTCPPSVRSFYAWEGPPGAAATGSWWWCWSWNRSASSPRTSHSRSISSSVFAAVIWMRKPTSFFGTSG